MPTTSLGIRYPGPYDTVNATSWQNLASDVDGLLTSLNTLREAANRPPSARVYGFSLQTVPFATPTTVIYNTEEWDTAGMANLGVNNDRLTLGSPGIYLISGSIWYGSGMTNVNHIETDVNFNGSQVAQNRSGPYYSGANPPSQAAMLVVASLPTDYVSMTAGWSGTGGPATLTEVYLQAVKVRNFP